MQINFSVGFGWRNQRQTHGRRGDSLEGLSRGKKLWEKSFERTVMKKCEMSITARVRRDGLVLCQTNNSIASTASRRTVLFLVFTLRTFPGLQRGALLAFVPRYWIRDDGAVTISDMCPPRRKGRSCVGPTQAADCSSLLFTPR